MRYALAGYTDEIAPKNGKDLLVSAAGRMLNFGERLEFTRPSAENRTVDRA